MIYIPENQPRNVNQVRSKHICKQCIISLVDFLIGTMIRIKFLCRAGRLALKQLKCNHTVSHHHHHYHHPCVMYQGCFMSSPYFGHKISKYLAWSRIQIIQQLLTNNLWTCLLAFWEQRKYIKRQNIEKSLSVLQPKPNTSVYFIFFCQSYEYTGYTHNNGAILKVNKKFIIHLTRVQHTPSAATTVQVSYALPAVLFSCLLRGSEASIQDGVAAGKGFLCAPFWGVCRSVITVQREFRARFRKEAPCVFSKPCTKLTLHCNHRSGHLKTEHTESLFLLRHLLENWLRSKHEKRTAGSAWETWTVAAADGVRCACVRWEINLLLTFKTAPFFCVNPVYC